MSGIGIGGFGSYSPIYNPTKYAEQMTSGRKINSAADDPAGAAIAKKLESQSGGSSQAASNAYDSRNMLNVADGGMSQIASGLERIRELGVQAQNGIYGASERAIFQEEINGILSNIDSFGKNTNYNGKNLLDGSFTAQSAIVGANGQSVQMDIGSSLTEDLGIAGFDVTKGNFSLDTIDQALETLSSQQANVGAYSNRLEYSARAAENAAVNMEAARSRVEDADIAEASRENNRQRITEDVSISMQKLKMQGMGNFLQLIG